MNKQGGLMNTELIKALKEDAEWAHANEWETPITLGDHLDAAADALEAAEAENRWIPVSERLPETGDTFLVAIKEKYKSDKEWNYHVDSAVSFGDYIDGFWDTWNDWIEGQEVHVTHWQKLPRPPQKG